MTTDKCEELTELVDASKVKSKDYWDDFLKARARQTDIERKVGESIKNKATSATDVVQKATNKVKTPKKPINEEKQ